MAKEMPAIRIVIADDHEIFRDGFRVMVKKFPEFKLVGEAEDGEKLMEIVDKHKPDIIFMDIKMPNVDGIEATRRLLLKDPRYKIIALSMYDEEDMIIDMLEAGAKGYLLKNSHKEDIADAIWSVHEGRSFFCKTTSAKLVQMISKSKFNPYRKTAEPEFTEKEIEVIRLICDQFSNREIAEKLDLSVRTIEGYRDRIQEKMDVKNTAGIVVYAIRKSIYQVKK